MNTKAQLIFNREMVGRIYEVVSNLRLLQYEVTCRLRLHRSPFRAKRMHDLHDGNVENADRSVPRRGPCSSFSAMASRLLL